jgi:hypothetical protein
MSWVSRAFLVAFILSVPAWAKKARTRMRPIPTGDVRVFFAAKSSKILLRFTGSAALEFKSQLTKKYKKKVIGLVDGQDTSCGTYPGPIKAESVCAFVIENSGQISNAFSPNPTEKVMIGAQFVLAAEAEMSKDIRSGSLRAHGWTEITPLVGPTLVQRRPDRDHSKLKLAGPAAQLIFNFIDTGSPFKNAIPKRHFQRSLTPTVSSTRGSVKCVAEKRYAPTAPMSSSSVTSLINALSLADEATAIGRGKRSPASKAQKNEAPIAYDCEIPFKLPSGAALKM